MSITELAETPAQQSRPWFREVTGTQWRALVAAWIGYTLDAFDLGILSLVLVRVSHEFRLGTATAATLMSAAYVSRWFGGALLGTLADRFGRRPAMIASIVLYSVGTFACGLSWDYWSMFAARLIVGIGMAGEVGVSGSYILETWPARVRHRGSGLLFSGYGLGAILAVETSKVVVPNWGWRWMFFLGLLPVLVGVLLRRVLPETPQWQREVGGAARARNPFLELFRTGSRAWINGAVGLTLAAATLLIATRQATGLWGVAAWVVAAACVVGYAVQFDRTKWTLTVSLIVTTFFIYMYAWPIQALLPTYLQTNLHLHTNQASDVLFYAGLGTMVGYWSAGFLGDWLGTRRAYVVSLVISLAFVFPVFAVPGHQLVLLSALIFFLQAFNFGVGGLVPKYLSGFYPTAVRAAALGFIYNVAALGGAMAPLIGNAIAERLSLGQALAICTFGSTGLVILLVGFNVPARIHRWAGGSVTDYFHDAPVVTQRDSILADQDSPLGKVTTGERG